MRTTFLLESMSVSLKTYNSNLLVSSRLESTEAPIPREINQEVEGEGFRKISR